MDSTLAFDKSVPSRLGAAVSAGRRVALSAALLATACVLGLVEASMPPIAPLPWLKVGFANIAVVVALLVIGPRTAALVSGGKVLVVAIVTGTLASVPFVMAATGAIVSLLVMAGLSRVTGSLSAVGLSAAGSAAHVAAQFGVAAVTLGTPSILVLAPPSVLASLVFGMATGFMAGLTVSRLHAR